MLWFTHTHTHTLERAHKLEGLPCPWAVFTCPDPVRTETLSLAAKFELQLSCREIYTQVWAYEWVCVYVCAYM